MSGTKDTTLLDQGQRSSWEAMLQARPVANAAAQIERADADEVKITVKKQRPWFLKPPLSWVVRAKSHRTVTLDRLGTQVWQLCDGQRTVEEVVDTFASAHRLSFHEARIAVTGYLKGLVQRGALAMVMS